jgi:cell division ATPase FtsA
MIDLKVDVPHLLDVPLDRIVFTGGGAKLEGFLNIAKYVMQKNVRLATPRGLDGMPEGTNDPSYSAAVGIALWSLKNLPAENQVEARKSYPSTSKPAEALNGSESSTGALSMLKGWLPRRASSDKSHQKETADL